jgi:hypothetical protein
MAEMIDYTAGILKPKKYIDSTDMYFGDMPTAPVADEPFKFGVDASKMGAEGSVLKNSQNLVSDGFDFSNLFSSDNLAGTIGGVGTALSGAASVYNAIQTKNYQDKLFKMEKERVDRANARQEKLQNNYEKSKGW